MHVCASEESRERRRRGEERGEDIILPPTQAFVHARGDEEGGEKFLSLLSFREGVEEKEKEFSPSHAHETREERLNGKERDPRRERENEERSTLERETCGRERGEMKRFASLLSERERLNRERKRGGR